MRLTLNIKLCTRVISICYFCFSYVTKCQEKVSNNHKIVLEYMMLKSGESFGEFTLIF